MPGVPIHPLTQLLEASGHASAARRLLRVLRDVALLGGPAHPDALDAAILRHRQAQWELASAMASWARWHQRQQGTYSPDTEALEQRAA